MLEFLFEILGEFLLQAVGEALLEIGLHALLPPSSARPTPGWPRRATCSSAPRWVA